MSFGAPPPGKDTVTGYHRKSLDPGTAMLLASLKDEKSVSALSKVKSTFKVLVSDAL
jgi:hypothetical protein